MFYNLEPYTLGHIYSLTHILNNIDPIGAFERNRAYSRCMMDLAFIDDPAYYKSKIIKLLNDIKDTFVGRCKIAIHKELRFNILKPMNIPYELIHIINNLD